MYNEFTIKANIGAQGFVGLDCIIDGAYIFITAEEFYEYDTEDNCYMNMAEYASDYGWAFVKAVDAAFKTFKN